MARFRTSASFAGKGQTDLAARVASLVAMGEAEPPANAHHPHLFSRRAVREAETRLGVEWAGFQKRHVNAYFKP